MNRLANASSRSTLFEHLRADQDDERPEVDPCQEAGGDRKRPVGGERPERPGEGAQRQIGNLPLQGGHPSRLRRDPVGGASTRERAVDDVEEEEADDEPEDRGKRPPRDGDRRARGGWGDERARERRNPGGKPE